METLKERVKRESSSCGCSCEYTERSASLISVIKKSGYKIEPDLDGDGNPVSRRTTPLHYAVTHDCSFYCEELFDVYGCDVNYADENGLTHLHAAISSCVVNYLDEFLERGYATYVPEESDTVDPPLHYALNEGESYAVEQLIAKGADPNLANKDGLTPLHIICKSSREYYTEYFFKAIDNNNIGPLQIDARDKLGRTPLQWAVSSLMTKTIDVLLDRGADLSDFVFPDESYFALKLQQIKRLEGFEVGLAAGTLDVVKRLEARGYHLDQDAVQTIMKVFAKLGIFKNTQKYSLADPYFVGRSKKLMVSPKVSLYKLCQMSPKEAMKLAKLEDYVRFAISRKFWKLRKEYRQACGRHLCEMVSRQFFRRWALQHFSTLTRSDLSIYNYEKIIDMLKNVDLWCICMAATGQISDDEEMEQYLEDTNEPYDHDHEECERSFLEKFFIFLNYPPASLPLVGIDQSDDRSTSLHCQFLKYMIHALVSVSRGVGVGGCSGCDDGGDEHQRGDEQERERQRRRSFMYYIVSTAPSELGGKREREDGRGVAAAGYRGWTDCDFYPCVLFAQFRTGVQLCEKNFKNFPFAPVVCPRARSLAESLPNDI
ncbi:unnamed protein product [Trichogramma brassicae]|uniref:Uncharacterized protein n=1 Tax=Trichogramma brassicae TaxID=86971 RepID=A0A6H5IDD0_9HYME|nr:unnamed protein product [Trichogramma brassicae]